VYSSRGQAIFDIESGTLSFHVALLHARQLNLLLPQDCNSRAMLVVAVFCGNQTI